MRLSSLFLFFDGMLLLVGMHGRTGSLDDMMECVTYG